MHFASTRLARRTPLGSTIILLLASAALALLPAAAAIAQTTYEVPSPSIPGRTVRVGPLLVKMSATRILAYEARTPLVVGFSNGTVLLNAGNPVVSTNLRSADQGQWWTPQATSLGYLNMVERPDGVLVAVDYDPPPKPGFPGQYLVERYESSDQGLTMQGPFLDGILTLPPVLFDPELFHWFNQIRVFSDGNLYGAIQSETVPGSTNQPWKSSLVLSSDGGRNWSYVSEIASQQTIVDPQGLLTKNGWPLYYATEPTIADVGGGHIVCVMRSTNDEKPGMPLTQIGPAMSSFHDLASTVPGTGVAPGLMTLDPGAYYSLGPPNAPLVLAHSFDGGATWGAATPMDPPRGVFPRLAWDGAGILALSYGALSGVPRWGNAISFSLDGGGTWIGEVVFGPFLTTGYTGLVATGPGTFLGFFDVTPPQSWTSYPRHWIGVVDLTVTRAVQPAVADPGRAIGH